MLTDRQESYVLTGRPGAEELRVDRQVGELRVDWSTAVREFGKRNCRRNHKKRN